MKVRMTCPGCGFVDWENPVPVAAAVLRMTEDIVLVRNRWYPRRQWSLPGGYVEPGENAEQGVVRELEEETGVKGRVTGILGTYPVDGGKHLLLIVFMVEPLGGELRPGEEIADVKRVSFREAVSLVEGSVDEQVLRDWARAQGTRFKPRDEA